MPERARQLAAIARAERVAVVLDDPEVVLLRQLADRVEIERHAERVRHHDRARLRSDGFAQPIDHGRVVAEIHVDEHRHEVVLENRRQRRRKAGRDGDDFVAGLQPAIAELRRRQRRQRDEVGRGARVHEQDVGRLEVRPPVALRRTRRSGSPSGRSRGSRRRAGTIRRRRRHGRRSGRDRSPARTGDGRTARGSTGEPVTRSVREADARQTPVTLSDDWGLGIKDSIFSAMRTRSSSFDGACDDRTVSRRPPGRQPPRHPFGRPRPQRRDRHEPAARHRRRD